MSGFCACGHTQRSYCFKVMRSAQYRAFLHLENSSLIRYQEQDHRILFSLVTLKTLVFAPVLQPAVQGVGARLGCWPHPVLLASGRADQCPAAVRELITQVAAKSSPLLWLLFMLHFSLLLSTRYLSLGRWREKN